MPYKHDNVYYDFDKKTLLVEKQSNEVQDEDAPKNWIIYARVSTDEQKRKWSGIKWQIRDCRERAKRNNVNIVHEPFYDEAVSWTKLKRKWFNKALEYVKEQNKNTHKIDYFICDSTSRFSRNADLWKNFELIRELNSVWVELVAVWSWGIQELETEGWYMSYSLKAIMDAMESRRWKQRVRYWIRWKILEWYWPFAEVPVWYKRIVTKEWEKEIKILILDEEKAPILKEWLELFWNWVLLSKQNLYDYLEERWLKSNSKVNKTWKLHHSILDKILLPRKLYVYAGYITYPEMGVNEPVKARHEPIISLDTLHKIMLRLKKYEKWPDYKLKKYDGDYAEYPLKRILSCPLCWNHVTKRKSRWKSWAYFHYYWCNTPGCKLFKKGLPREAVHNAIKDNLNQITPPLDIEKSFKSLFEKERKEEKDGMNLASENKMETVKWIEKEMERIEKMLENITDTALFQKKQEQRTELNKKKEEIKNTIMDVTVNQENFEELYNEAHDILFNPSKIWDVWSFELRQLLIGVCYGGQISYSKKDGLHTPSLSSLYLYFQQIGNSKNLKPGGAESWTPV